MWFHMEYDPTNTHNFVKNDPKFENKALFHAKVYRAWHEKKIRSQSCDIWSLEPSWREFKPFATTYKTISPKP